MANDAQRKVALDRIRQNIAEHGHHVYVVSGGGNPRYAYTIGLSESLGTELILAGACFYLLDDIPKIINSIATKLTPQVDWTKVKFDVESFGAFSLCKAHMSWATTLMLGALDFYQVREIPALQIVPDEAHWTIDVPDMTAPWSAITAEVWRGLHEPWAYPVPANSVAVTNLGALRGERVTEAVRWEEDEWELFAGAGPDAPEEERRVVPLGVLLATDESLVPVVSLSIGSGLWRDAVSEWHPWRAGGPG